MEFYVGTLTREGGEGILRCRLAGDHIERTGLIRGVTDPTWQTLSPDGKRLYSTCSDIPDGERRGCVNEYSLESGEPVLLNRRAVLGDGPCHLTLSPDGRFLYCANYNTGSVAVFPVERGLEPCAQVVEHHGKGPHPARQEGPHVHQVTFLPGTWDLCAVDLGTDKLAIYHVSPGDGTLTFARTITTHGGPRHVVYGRDHLMYLAHELSSEVSVIRWDTGETLQTLSTLPGGCAMENYPGAIRIAGGRLYVSNRLHGSLAAFGFTPEGLLRPEGHLPAGEYPRDFVFLKDGRYLAADQWAGVWLMDREGNTLDFLPQKGAVRICCAFEPGAL